MLLRSWIVLLLTLHRCQLLAGGSSYELQPNSDYQYKNAAGAWGVDDGISRRRLARADAEPAGSGSAGSGRKLGSTLVSETVQLTPGHRPSPTPSTTMMTPPPSIILSSQVVTDPTLATLVVSSSNSAAVLLLPSSVSSLSVLFLSPSPSKPSSLSAFPSSSFTSSSLPSLSESLPGPTAILSPSPSTPPLVTPSPQLHTTTATVTFEVEPLVPTPSSITEFTTTTSLSPAPVSGSDFELVELFWIIVASGGGCIVILLACIAMVICGWCCLCAKKRKRRNLVYKLEGFECQEYPSWQNAYFPAPESPASAPRPLSQTITNPMANSVFNIVHEL